MGCNSSNELVDVDEEEELKIMAGRIKVTVGEGPYALLGPRRPKSPIVSPRKSNRVKTAENIDDLLASSPELESTCSEDEQDKVSKNLDEKTPDELPVENPENEREIRQDSDTFSEFTLSDLQSITSTKLAEQETEIPFETEDPAFRPVRESAPRVKYKAGNYYSVTMSPIQSNEDIQEAVRINEEIMEMAKFDIKSKQKGKKTTSNATSRRQSKFGSKLSLANAKTVRIAPDPKAIPPPDPLERDTPATILPEDYDVPMDGRINKQLG